MKNKRMTEMAEDIASKIDDKTPFRRFYSEVLRPIYDELELQVRESVDDSDYKKVEQAIYWPVKNQVVVEVEARNKFTIYEQWAEQFRGKMNDKGEPIIEESGLDENFEAKWPKSKAPGLMR